MNGPITVLVTDNAPSYRSEQMKKWCRSRGITHQFTAPYRHQSSGVVERCNRTVVQQLRKRVKLYGTAWPEELDEVVRSINTSVHSTTKKTPRELWAATSAEIREAKILLDKAREKVNQRLKTHPEALAVGDIVLMYDHGRVKKRRHKLLPRWQGPYILEAKLPGGSWKLQSVKMHERGRRPILVSHESYLQLFDDRDFVW